MDQVFDGVFKYLEHLKAMLKRSGATDKGSDPYQTRASRTLASFLILISLCLLSEYVQAFKLLEHLDCSSSLASLQDQDTSVVQVVIGSGKPW